MSNKIKDKQVQYDAFHFEKSAKAKTLHNSSGTKQGRLHLLGHNGLKGMDHHAVAAKVMKFKDGEAPKLGWWDRKYNVLVELPSEDGITKTWYKINKQSFIKRFNPSEDLKIDKETGVCSNLADLVAAKSIALAKLEAISNAKTPFEKEFLNQLSENNHADSYNQIIFIQIENNLNSLTIPMVESHPVLFISYKGNDKEIDRIKFDALYGSRKSTIEELVGHSYPVGVNIDYSQYKKILSGKPIPQPVIDTIKDEALQLPEGEIWIGLNARARDFQLHFKFYRDTKISEFQQLIDKIKIEFFNGGNSYISGHPNEDCESEATLISILTKNEDNEFVRSYTKYQDQVLSPSFVLDQLKILQQKPS